MRSTTLDSYRKKEDSNLKYDEPAQATNIAQTAAAHALFNCLIKEFALPEGLIRYQWPQEGDFLPAVIKQTAEQIVPLHITMADQSEFFVLVDRKSSLGSQYYLSEIYGKLYRGRWAKLDAELLAARLLSSCSSNETLQNGELFKQIQSSITLSEDIVQHIQNDPPQYFANYVSSEQNLWFGHPSHPAPKARMWPDYISFAKYSPEFSPQIKMHVLEVPVSGLKLTTDDKDHAKILEGIADQKECAVDHVRISLHPVQAKLFLNDSRVKRLLLQRVIKDLGESGFDARPTASIRTMYVDGHDYFIKTSLNIRITNCVRKNAWYELESAIIINRLLHTLVSQDIASTGHINLINEPAAISWHPEGACDEDKIWFTEQTGAILRQNFCKARDNVHHVIAATLFARDLELKSNSNQFFRYWAVKGSDPVRLEWFDQYQKALLKPVLFLFYNHGIVLEPHLQNTVIEHANGHVTRLLLRDYEGVKLTTDKGINYLDNSVDPVVRKSMEYSRQAGWNRISYCLFINNLSEAILALSADKPDLAQTMWQRVHNQLQEIKQTLPCSTPELDALIATGDIACKTNFKVRLAAQADKKAGYVMLKAPWYKEDSNHE